MGRIVVAGVLAVLAAAGAVQLAGAAPDPTARVPAIGKLAMSTTDPFTGKLVTTSDLKECRGPRPIRIIDANTRAIVAHTTTNKAGRWSKPRPFFIGSVFAEAPRVLGGCPRARPSRVTTFAPAPRADLAITKVAIGNDGDHSAQYTVTVTNLGPAQADGVVVADDPATTFVAAGSDPRCAPDGGTLFSCAIGALAPGSATTLLVKVDCMTPTVNSASVSSTTSDPNTANNSTGLVASGACPA